MRIILMDKKGICYCFRSENALELSTETSANVVLANDSHHATSAELCFDDVGLLAD